MKASWNVRHECAPAPLVGEDRGAGVVDAQLRPLGAVLGDLGLNALVGHHPVHEPEAAQWLRCVIGRAGGE